MLHAPQSSAKDARDSLASFKPTFEAIGFHLDVHVVRSIVRGEVHTCGTMGSTRESTKLAIIFPQDLKQKQ